MKNFDLNNYGVQEMNTVEMKEIDGGHPLLWLLAGVIIAELLDRNAANDFSDGQNAYRNR